MTETRPYVSWELMGDFMTAVFVKLGVPKEDAAVCADVLMESDRRGIESHGCNRFKPIYVDRIQQGILNPDVVWQLWEDYKERNQWRVQIWYILMFQQWMSERIC